MLLGRGLVSGLSLGEFGVTVVEDGGKFGVVDDGSDESDNVGDLLSGSFVNQAGEEIGYSGNDEDIGEGDSLSNKESLGEEDFVEGGESLNDGLVVGLESGLVIWDSTANHSVGNRVLDEELNLISGAQESLWWKSRLTSWSAKHCHWWTWARSLGSEGRMVWLAPSSATRVDQVSSTPSKYFNSRRDRIR